MDKMDGFPIIGFKFRIAVIDARVILMRRSVISIHTLNTGSSSAQYPPSARNHTAKSFLSVAVGTQHLQEASEWLQIGQIFMAALNFCLRLASNDSFV